MNIDMLPYTLLCYLFLTIILELVLSLILGLRKKDLIYVILVNVLTNPLLNSLCTLVYVKYFYKGFIISIVILEILAFLVEGLIYKKVLNYKKINPILLSLILNLFSFIVGLVINNIVL